MVHPGDALEARTDEGGRQDHPFAQATHLELVRGEKRHLTWRRRRPKQQSKSGDQKILRIQDSGHAQNLAISQARQTSGSRNRPRIFLTKEYFTGSISRPPRPTSFLITKSGSGGLFT